MGIYIPGIIFLLPIIFYGVYVFKGIEKNEKYKEKAKKDTNQRMINEASDLSQKLRDLIIKSDELATKGLSDQIKIIENKLRKVEYEFSDNALIPFWDEVENFVKELDQYENSLNLLKENSKLYYKYIHTTKNNFPQKFPISTNHRFPNHIISNFEQIKRQAFKKFEFANLWEQRKTQKILVLGFSTLGEAINNMNYSITNAVNELTDVVQTGFESLASEIQESRQREYNNHMVSNAQLESSLSKIDEKLYYIQYNRKPIEPFGDIFAERR